MPDQPRGFSSTGPLSSKKAISRKSLIHKELEEVTKSLSLSGTRDASVEECSTHQKETNMTDNQNEQPSNENNQATEEISKDMAELIAAIGNLPEEFRQQIEPVMTRVAESTRRRRRILNLVQEALGQLRLDMKYLMFDLEATRRERDEYRNKLGDK